MSLSLADFLCSFACVSLCQFLFISAVSPFLSDALLFLSLCLTRTCTFPDDVLSLYFSDNLCGSLTHLLSITLCVCVSLGLSVSPTLLLLCCPLILFLCGHFLLLCFFLNHLISLSPCLPLMFVSPCVKFSITVCLSLSFAL